MHYRYKRAEDAKMALEQMEGFELAGRTVGIVASLTLIHTHISAPSATRQHSP